MDWLAHHYKEVIMALWIADQIAAMTPKSWKPFGIPVGEYDNILVSLLKNALKKIFNK